MRSRLIERVTMLTENKCSLPKTLVYEKFSKSYDTRATITPIGYTTDEVKVYSIIIPMPPAIFSNVSFAGIMWNSMEYVFSSPLKEWSSSQRLKNNQMKFLKGIITPVA